MTVIDKKSFSFKFKAVDTEDQMLSTTFSRRRLHGLYSSMDFLSTTVLTQAANRYVFCVVQKKKLSIIKSCQCVFCFEKPKRIDWFLLSTVFSQLLIDNFDDTQQNLG